VREQFDNPLPSRLIYIRPVIFGTTPHIMPIPSVDYLLTVSVAPYFPSALPERLRLKVEPTFRRTAERGLGSAKTASNYAHQFAPSETAKQQGYDALLWLESGSSERITEASSMNVFFVTTQGILTPSLNEQLLPGLTRASAIRVAREELGMNVREVPITTGDIESWHRGGKLEGMFITSTARGVRPVSALNLSGEDISFDIRKDFACHAIASRLRELREGTGDDPYGWRQTLMLETRPGDREQAERR
jgi:branched-chain amino acid aminotransferase